MHNCRKRNYFAIAALILTLLFTTACNKNSSANRNQQSKEHLEETSISNDRVTSDDKITVDDYLEALTKEEKQETQEIAENYYADKDWLQFLSLQETDEVARYLNEGLESNYLPAHIIVYDVKVIHDECEMVRHISIARDKEGDWQVINEGY